MRRSASIASRIVCLAASVGVLIAAPSIASAATISIAGGFTAYNGQAGCSFQFQTIFNGEDVSPSLSACDSNFLWAPLSLTFDDVEESVSFYGIQGGELLTPNGLAFIPAGPQQINNLGDEILLGTLLYTNGTWFGSGRSAAFELQITTSSSDPRFDGHLLVDDLILDITPTVVGPPEQNADFVFFDSFQTLGSFRVYESFDSPTGSNSGSVQLYGRISSIIPTRFDAAGGGGFVDPSVGIAPVPEPASLLLLGSGLAALVRARRRA